MNFHCLLLWASKLYEVRIFHAYTSDLIWYNFIDAFYNLCDQLLRQRKKIKIKTVAYFVTHEIKQTLNFNEFNFQHDFISGITFKCVPSIWSASKQTYVHVRRKYAYIIETIVLHKKRQQFMIIFTFIFNVKLVKCNDLLPYYHIFFLVIVYVYLHSHILLPLIVVKLSHLLTLLTSNVHYY